MTNTTLDIVSVMTFLATIIFAPAVAAVVGPYMVILLASTIGASFALARREKTSRVSAGRFFFRTNGLAILLTAGLAAMVSTLRPDVGERFLFAPIAFLLGLVGDDWSRVGLWAGRKLNALIDAMIKMRSGGG